MIFLINILRNLFILFIIIRIKINNGVLPNKLYLYKIPLITNIFCFAFLKSKVVNKDNIIIGKTTL